MWTTFVLMDLLKCDVQKNWPLVTLDRFHYYLTKHHFGRIEKKNPNTRTMRELQQNSCGIFRFFLNGGPNWHLTEAVAFLFKWAQKWQKFRIIKKMQTGCAPNLQLFDNWVSVFIWHFFKEIFQRFWNCVNNYFRPLSSVAVCPLVRSCVTVTVEIL